MITVRAFFHNLNTQTKLLVGFAVVGFIVLLVGMLGIVGLVRLGNALQTVYTDSTLSLANVAASSTSLGLYHDAVLEATRAPRRTEFERAVQKLSGLKEATLDPLRQYAGGNLRLSRSGASEEQDLVALADAVIVYFRAAEGAIGCLNDSFSERSSIEGRKLMHDLGQLSASTDVAARYAEATSRFRKIGSTARSIAKDFNDEGQAVAQEGKRLLIIGLLLALVLGLGLGYLLSRKISRSVTHITDVAVRAASGQYQARAELQGQDEFGQMATAFNAMLDRITALVQTEEDRDRLQRHLMDFLALVDQVSQGDLTKRGALTADMFGELCVAFNLMLDRFCKLMGKAKKAADRLAEAAIVMRDMADETVSICHKQEEEAVDGLTAIQGLAEAMRQISITADASSRSAQQTLAATEQGRMTAEETVSGIKTIQGPIQEVSKQLRYLGTRSLEISEVVRKIQEIAYDTKLLALNASMEEIGPGDSDARFAVVAGQVREVAENSTRAVKEITELVGAIQTETRAVVAVMEQDTTAMETKSGFVLRSDQVFRDISRMAERSAELAETIAGFSRDQQWQRRASAKRSDNSPTGRWPFANRRKRPA
ncbi:MAG: methyl-accepting chemotaxis protein [Nitrospirota bacterium]